MPRTGRKREWLFMDWIAIGSGFGVGALVGMTGVGGGIGHATLGHIEWGLLGALLIGSLPGIWLGAQLAKAMPERLVRSLLCASLVTAGLKVIH